MPKQKRLKLKLTEFLKEGSMERRQLLAELEPKLTRGVGRPPRSGKAGAALWAMVHAVMNAKHISQVKACEWLERHNNNSIEDRRWQRVKQPDLPESYLERWKPQNGRWDADTLYRECNTANQRYKKLAKFLADQRFIKYSELLYDLRFKTAAKFFDNELAEFLGKEDAEFLIECDFLLAVFEEATRPGGWNALWQAAEA